MDYRVKQCAQDLQKTKLLAKLAGGSDLIALNAVYHPGCLARLYNEHVKLMSIKSPEDEQRRIAEGIVLNELVSFMESSRGEDTAPHFLLSDLVKTYTARLREFEVDIPDRVNSTRLKEKILNMMPSLTAQNKGKEVILVFSDDIADAISKAEKNDYDMDARYLVKAAQVIRKEIFNSAASFNGHFEVGCEENIVPKSLMALTSMILEGPNIKDQKCKSKGKRRITISLSELIMFNIVRR